MAELLPPDLTRVQMTFSVAGGEISVGTFHFLQPTAGMNETEARRIGNAVKAFYTGLSTVIASATITSTVVRASAHGVPEGGDWAQGWSFPDITGTVGGGGQGMPNQLALVLSLVSSSPTRSGRGRLYVGPVLSSIATSLSGDILVTDAARTSLNTAATTLRTSQATAGTPWVIFSRTKQAMNNVVSTRVGNRFDTVRRRRSGLREQYLVSA